METSAGKSIRISHLVANSYHSWIPYHMLQECPGFGRWPEQHEPAQQCACSCTLPLISSPRNCAWSHLHYSSEKPPVRLCFPKLVLSAFQSSLLYFCQSLTPLCNLWYHTLGSLHWCYSMKCEQFIVFQEIMFLPSCVFIFIKAEGKSPAAGEDEK